MQGLDKKDTIRSRIRTLIEKEDKKHPYSDQTLADLLARDGLTVSKRLVTKYRNEMELPDSARRRQYE